jgi:hypothetical protein
MLLAPVNYSVAMLNPIQGPASKLVQINTYSSVLKNTHTYSQGRIQDLGIGGAKEKKALKR